MAIFESGEISEDRIRDIFCNGTERNNQALREGQCFQWCWTNPGTGQEASRSPPMAGQWLWSIIIPFKLSVKHSLDALVKSQKACFFWKLVPPSGDRSGKTSRNLWKYLPADCRRRAVCRTDHPESHAAVLPSKRRRSSGKGSGETWHERLNCTLGQRCPNLAGKTLFFSRYRDFHKIRIQSFSEALLIINN